MEELEPEISLGSQLPSSFLEAMSFRNSSISWLAGGPNEIMSVDYSAQCPASNRFLS